MKYKFWLALLVLLSVLVISDLSAQSVAVPNLINYQGKLTDANGDPLPTAEYTLQFNIYNGPGGGAELVWGPQIFDGGVGMGHGAKVPVVQGFFNVILGLHDTSGRSIANAFAMDNRYLEIQIGSDPPISPRQQMLSAPYAIQAAGSVPVGGVVPFFADASALPENWQVCNGQLITDPDSPLNGTFTPDLRNRFLRGSEFSYGITGGSNQHTHYNYISAWFPRRSLSNPINAHYPVKVNEAGSFDLTRVIVEVDAADYLGTSGLYPMDSHGHTDGIASGDTYSSLNVPEHITAVFIMRIK